MTLQTTLIEFIKALLGTGSESIQLRDHFTQDPQGALNEYGLGHLSPEDVHDAMVLVQDNDTVSFDRNFDTGFSWDGAGGGWGGGHQDQAVHAREYVSNQHVTNDVDDRDTVVDNSINQNIDTGGGDLDQHFENNSVTASGDGAVAAGRDIEDSTITTGDGNVVGDGNAVVNGDDNTTAFGEGSAVTAGDIAADHGGAVSVGGDASGSQVTEDSYNDTRTESHTSTEIDDSYNPDSSTHLDTDVDDHSSTHNDVLSHNDTTVDLQPIL